MHGKSEGGWGSNIQVLDMLNCEYFVSKIFNEIIFRVK